MRKLEALKIREVQREEKRKKNAFCELKMHVTPFPLHFKDDFSR
jgi:hypothetical protein